MNLPTARTPLRKLVSTSAMAILLGATMLSCGEPPASKSPLTSTCNEVTCPSGCCQGNFCSSGLSTQACGSGGLVCNDCSALGGTCDADTQQCGAATSPPEQSPQDGPPETTVPEVTPPVTCAPDCSGKCRGTSDGCGGICKTSDCSGCCQGTLCQPGTSDTACGKNGTTAMPDGSCYTCPNEFKGCQWRCNAGNATCETIPDTCE